MPIDPKRVEAAARARFKRHGASWDALSEETREFMLREITADLAAAWPELASDPPTAWATYSHEDDEHVGHLYCFRPVGRAPGPYTTQRHVSAIIDVADDGTLAGVELIDTMPPPPRDAHTKEQGGT